MDKSRGGFKGGYRLQVGTRVERKKDEKAGQV